MIVGFRRRNAAVMVRDSAVALKFGFHGLGPFKAGILWRL